MDSRFYRGKPDTEDVDVSDTDNTIIEFGRTADGLKITLCELQPDETWKKIAYICLTKKRAQEFINAASEMLNK